MATDDGPPNTKKGNVSDKHTHDHHATELKIQAFRPAHQRNGHQKTGVERDNAGGKLRGAAPRARDTRSTP